MRPVLIAATFVGLLVAFSPSANAQGRTGPEGTKANIESYYDQGTYHMREAMLLGFTGVDEAKIHPDLDNMRKNPRIASKLNNAMFEPDNLFRLTKLSGEAKK